MVWVDHFRQFLNRALQRIRAWAQEIRILPVSLRQAGFFQEDAYQLTEQSSGDQHVELTYCFRSLQCHMRVRILETTPGMQFIYRALQRSTDS